MRHLSEQYDKAVERELADRKPFGDSQHINHLVDNLYLRRLSMAEGVFPAATAVMDQLRCLTVDAQHYFLRDPAFRMGVDQAFLHAKALPVRHTIDSTERLLERAASLLKSRGRTALLEAGAVSTKLGERLCSPRLWEDCGSNPSSNCVLEMIREIVPEAHIDRPYEKQVATLQAAVRLLDRLLPWLSQSALNHAVTVVIVSDRETPGSGYRGFRSGTTSSLPGVVVLSASELATPWRAAEALLHESLHLKFIDLEFTHSMDVKDRTAAPCRIRPPWCALSASEGWPAIRGMTAAHVYIGLDLLFRNGRREAMRSDPTLLGIVSPAELREASLRANDRAQFLLCALEENLQYLGLAGQHFVAWLGGLQSLKRDIIPAMTVGLVDTRIKRIEKAV